MMKIALFIIAGIIAFTLMIWLLQTLWNWLVPALFKGPRIRFGQALGLFILCRLLFGFGFSHGHPGYFQHPFNRMSCERQSVHKNHEWFWKGESQEDDKNEKTSPDRNN
jgi:hypothetical protein